MRWKDALAVTLRFTISWTIGWIVAWAIVGLGKDTLIELGSSVSDTLGQGALVSRVFLSWGSTWGIAGTIAGIVAGGLAYTVGLIFYQWRKLPYSHAVWHLFVLAGSVFHFFAVLFGVGIPG